MTLRLGTRASLLARTQSGLVADALTAATGLPCELVPIRSEGDDPRVSLDAPPRPGAFVATLRDALFAGEVDFVVHSYKDLPSAPLPGLVIAAVPAREDARDVLVSRTGAPLPELAPGAVVGTSSPRRSAAIRRARPDLVITPIRGNIDTRLRLVATGDLDAIVLAAAGLSRVGRLSEASEIFDLAVLVPAPSQGALAIECRAGDPLATALAVLEDHRSRVEVTAERAVLEGVAATCATAVGARATWSDGCLDLTADLADHAGVTYARITESVTLGPAADVHPAVPIIAAANLGHSVAARLLTGTP
ncbi:MAG: hydroxymethylbilane synthase [Dermatophilaceae bacterium]